MRRYQWKGGRPMVMLPAGAMLLLAMLIVAVPVWAGAAGDEKVLPETIEFPSSVGLVEFPHAAHVEENGIDCITCHHETGAETLQIPHPDYFDDFWVDCTICHTGRPASPSSHRCQTCHPDHPTRTAIEMPSVKVAIHRSCWSCHKQGTGAKASADCDVCHQHQKRTSAPDSGG